MLMDHAQRLRSSSFVSRSLASVFFVGASALALHAQQAATVAENTPPANIFAVTNAPNLDLAAAAGVNYSSSASSVDGLDPVEAERLNLSSDATQPPPRRRYGRPRYNDSSHNPDGSNKYAFMVGGGFTAPVGNTYHYLNTNYAFQVGVGRNFNKHATLMAQFDYDNFGFNGRTLYQQSVIEDPNNLYGVQGLLDGKSHVWSFSLDPTYNVSVNDSVGAYVVVGVGLYHKTANFTVPATGTYCDYYYGCFQYQANETIDKYTSNAPGFNGGFGLTYKPSRFANERLYAEARYVFVDNSQKFGINYSNYNTTTGINYTGANFYPANSNRTPYTVYKAGIRF